MKEQLKNAITLPVKFMPMSVKPEESGMYTVIWCDYTDKFSFQQMSFSKRYNLWNVFDSAEDAFDAIKTSHEGIKPEMCVAWVHMDFEQIVESIKEEDDF